MSKTATDNQLNGEVAATCLNPLIGTHQTIVEPTCIRRA